MGIFFKAVADHCYFSGSRTIVFFLMASVKENKGGIFYVVRYWWPVPADNHFYGHVIEPAVKILPVGQDLLDQQLQYFFRFFFYINHELESVVRIMTGPAMKLLK